MRPGLSEIELEKMLADSGVESAISGAYSHSYVENRRIPKFSLEENATVRQIIPLSLAVPFNPVNPADRRFTEKNPFIFKTSVEAAWKILEMQAKKNPEVEKQIKYMIGHVPTDEDWAASGQRLAHMLKDFRIVDPKGDYTASTPLLNQRGFDTKYKVPTTVDGDGIAHHTGLLAELSDLESELIRPQMEELGKKFKKGGEWAHYNKKQKATARQSVAANACVSTVRYFVIGKVLSFVLDKEKLKSEDRTAIVDGKFTDAERWISLPKDKRDAFLKKLGGDIDEYPSFVEYNIEFGDEDAKDRYDKASRTIVKPTDSLFLEIPNFYEMYLAYRDDPKMQDDDLLIKSVNAIQPVNEALLLEAYQSTIKNYDRALFTQEVVDKFLPIIRNVDEAFADELEKASVKGKLESRDADEDALMEAMSAEEAEIDVEKEGQTDLDTNNMKGELKTTEVITEAVKEQATPAQTQAAPETQPAVTQAATATATTGAVDLSGLSAQGLNMSPDQLAQFGAALNVDGIK